MKTSDKRTRGPADLRLAALLILLLPLSALAESWALSAEEWSRPRSGEVILAMPPVAAAMEEWGQHPDTRLELLYPGGESGELWVAELRDWLIALGAEAERVELLPGSGSEDELILRLRH